MHQLHSQLSTKLSSQWRPYLSFSTNVRCEYGYSDWRVPMGVSSFSIYSDNYKGITSCTPVKVFVRTAGNSDMREERDCTSSLFLWKNEKCESGCRDERRHTEGQSGRPKNDICPGTSSPWASAQSRILRSVSERFSDRTQTFRLQAQSALVSLFYVPSAWDINAGDRYRALL